MKTSHLLIILSSQFAVGLGCKTVSVSKNKIENTMSENRLQDGIVFSEVRRVNRSVSLNEYALLTTFEETSNLYSKLDDRKFKRSEPIPALFDNEFFLVLKPKLKYKTYGDIEVIRIEEINKELKVYYKEIKNEEYEADKLKDPILILRLTCKLPSNVKLINVNE